MVKRLSKMDGLIEQAKPKRKGNYKAGPGRPPGSKNKKTLAMEAAAQKAVAEIDGAFDGDAHAFLQAVYKNPEVPLEIRIMAASRALRVEKPVLSATNSQVNVNFNMAERLETARLRAKALSRPDVIDLQPEPLPS
jgi:hypothetical protein